MQASRAVRHLPEHGVDHTVQSTQFPTKKWPNIADGRCTPVEMIVDQIKVAPLDITAIGVDSDLGPIKLTPDPMTQVREERRGRIRAVATKRFLFDKTGEALLPQQRPQHPTLTVQGHPPARSGEAPPGQQETLAW